MSTTTTNYGLIKPDTTDPILIGQLNDNADAIDAALKENADAIENKPDAADIPTPSAAAPAMDGTAAAGTSTDYARADHVHPSDTSKQSVLSAAQLAAVNSGIDSAKVDQIETNKNNILSVQTQANWNTNNGVKNFAPVSLIEKTGSTEGFVGRTDCRLAAGDYILSFDYTSTSSATPAFFNSTGALTKQLTAINGSGHKSRSFTVTSQDDIAGYYFYTMTAAKFENIMIRPAFIEDDTFEPYAMSNAELTAAIQALQAQLANQ